jgi:hypothetical protein
MFSRPRFFLFYLTVFLASCDFTEEERWFPPHPATIPYTCESAGTFIRMGDASVGHVFFIDDSTKSFYSFWHNTIYKYRLPGLQVKRSRSLPSNETVMYYCSRDETSGWLMTARHGGNLIANVIDTALNLTFKKDLGLFPGDLYKTTATTDKGFVIAANLYELGNDRYSVLRFSETGSLVWRRDVVPVASLRAIIALKDGGFLVGGSVSAAAGSYENDFLTKLNGDGKVLWTKSSQSGDRGIVDVIEDESGDYFLLLDNALGLTKLLRTDSAYNIKWSTLVDLPFEATLFQGDDGILVLSSLYYDNSVDIVFECYGDSGDKKWRNQFGGSGDEGASSVLNVDSGYYIIGSTTNWPEAGYVGVNRSYLIKTNLAGRS